MRCVILTIIFVPHHRWEAGDYISLIKDATAFSQEAMHAAHAINGPTYAHAIVMTEELIPQLSA
jgi:hypothetical protein